MPRHIEQPALRQSKPAARNTSSRPSASAWWATCWEPGTTIASTLEATRRPLTTSAAARRSPIREFVQEPMNTRSSRISWIGVPASSAMYLSARSSPSERGSGTASATPTTMPGLVPHVTCGRQRGGVDDDLLVEARAVLRAQLAPGGERGLEVLGRAGAALLEPGEGRVVGGDHAGAAAALDRHVAHRHAPLHREALDHGAGVLDDVAGGAVGAHLADRAEDQVLGGDAEAELALVGDPHRARLALAQALGREHVLDLAGADPERERAERAVGGGVRVAADDRHARLGDPQLRPDHVHDALAVGADRVQRDAELLAVALERLHLHARELVADARRRRGPVGGDVVVGGGERAVGPAHRAPGEPQALEGLRAGDLVHEVQVDVQQARRDLVRGPDLVEEGAHDRRSPAETTASRTASSFPWFSK